MLLEDFLQKNDIKKKVFSKKIGTSATSISYYCSGKRRPAAKIIEKIFRVTKGQVTPNDFHDLKKREV